MRRMLESSRESCLSLAAKAGKLNDQLPDRHVQIGVDRAAVNVATRQRESCARRKARGDSTMTAQYNLGRERVIGETRNRRKFLARELTQRIRKGQVMSGNVDGQISHGEQRSFEELGIHNLRPVNGGNRLACQPVACSIADRVWFFVFGAHSRSAKWDFCRCNARKG